MKTAVGILLIVVGVIGLAVGGINYTRREKVIDIGPIEATAEKHERIPLSADRRRPGAGGGRRAADRRQPPDVLRQERRHASGQVRACASDGESRAISARSAKGSAGFTTCASKPASLVCWRSRS